MLKSVLRPIAMHLQLCRQWVRNFVIWLSWDIRFLWLAIVPVAFAYGIIWLGEPSEMMLRGAGIFLEALGVLTVAWGLHETRKLFEKPSLMGHLNSWFKRFPKYRRNVHLQADSASSIGLGEQVTVDIWRNTEADDPIEKRVEALEVNLLRVKGELRDTQKDLNQRFREQENSLKKEVEGRSESDRRIEKKLEASETGGLHISATGLLWLLAGMPLTVFPKEIAALTL